ncbi:NADPH-dependent FMN reductase [Polaribacter sargassicola]|uniref:NADPH-dependent FMN reductase n=1 Tax=Polaribacter sargassicola TaxID=2836891 RepID=UPI001F176FA4|nr:NAD(P)H-dependent oxidoreductase [Polaribacter sp. DS7-9]MCG1036999.1 NAD(P)H-dependent oxidoreductase [Polaribacter sp. DS7-9]
MKKILAFAGSTSSTSINKKLATFAAENLENTSFDVIDLRDFNLPIYSEDEGKKGFPEDAKKFSALLDNYDGFILSLAEHNGTYTAAFKNIFDWASILEVKVFRDKPLLLMATSPGEMGGQFVLAAGEQRFTRQGAKELLTYSLPSFYDNFKEGKIVDQQLLDLLKVQVNKFEALVNQ